MDCRDLLTAFCLAPMLPFLAPVALASCICNGSRGIRLPFFGSDCGCRDSSEPATKSPAQQFIDLLNDNPEALQAIVALLPKKVAKEGEQKVAPPPPAQK